MRAVVVCGAEAGVVCAGTQVVVLGNNFYDSPGQRAVCVVCVCVC